MQGWFDPKGVLLAASVAGRVALESAHKYSTATEQFTQCVGYTGISMGYAT